MIINLPKDLEGHTTHRYGPNSFKLHRCGAQNSDRSAQHTAHTSQHTLYSTQRW